MIPDSGSLSFEAMSETPLPQTATVESSSADSISAEQIAAATALLEKLAADRANLLDIPDAERTRLLKAAGEVSRPDAILRRQMVKATKRQKKAERTVKLQEAENQLQETGIRKLRRQTVFTTPN